MTWISDSLPADARNRRSKSCGMTTKPRILLATSFGTTSRRSRTGSISK
jgi:hypothetical protein